MYRAGSIPFPLGGKIATARGGLHIVEMRVGGWRFNNTRRARFRLYSWPLI